MSDDAIPESMKPWAGGDGPPADWDGGPVLFREGHIGEAEDDSWMIGYGGPDPEPSPYDIIAYTPAPAIVTGLDERAREEYDVVGWATAMAAKGGPHEWGYRDVATGEFISDPWPFHAVEYIAALAASRPTEAGAGLAADVRGLRDQMQRIADHHPNDQPAYRDGVRPFGTGDLRHFIEVLDAATAALAALATQKPPVDEALTAALNQNDAMRQELANVGNLVSELARAMRVDQANPDGSWPDLAGRIQRLTDAAIRNLTGDGAGV